MLDNLLIALLIVGVIVALVIGGNYLANRSKRPDTPVEDEAGVIDDEADDAEIFFEPDFLDDDEMSDYDYGFEDGYEAGLHDGSMGLPAKVPSIGGEPSDYRDGFEDGYFEGHDDATLDADGQG